MAGADRRYLLGDLEGAPYGSAMWEYIKKSINPKYSSKEADSPGLLELLASNLTIEEVRAQISTNGDDADDNKLGKKNPIQKQRLVSYNAGYYFDVQADTTYKNFYTGDTPQLMPRLYAPVWPKDDDLLNDFAYVSVNPCKTATA